MKNKISLFCAFASGAAFTSVLYNLRDGKFAIAAVFIVALAVNGINALVYNKSK